MLRNTLIGGFVALMAQGHVDASWMSIVSMSVAFGGDMLLARGSSSWFVLMGLGTSL